MSPDKERRCTWSISVDLGRRIRLEFTDFDLKSSDGCFDHYVQARFQSCFLIGQQIIDCDSQFDTENSYQIFDGLESHSPNITDKLCRSLPPPIESHGHQMMILFETDYQSGEKGFSATYTSNENSICGGLVSIPATASADIKSPDYPSDYPPSTECKWLVDSHQTYNTTFKVTIAIIFIFTDMSATILDGLIALKYVLANFRSKIQNRRFSTL